MSDDPLYQRVAEILEQARAQVARTVNTAMVLAYWHIGREIVAVTQEGEPRARYGNEVVKRLANRLQREYGKGFSQANLFRMRQFYLAFPNGSAVRPGRAPILSTPSRKSRGADRPQSGSMALARSAQSAEIDFPSDLAWSHYVVLLRVANEQARAFYEIEAARERWSVRELERQIGALLFERLAKHRNADKVRDLAREGQTVATPGDVIKDPFVLEFLDLPEHPALHERDIEQAIIDRLETFMLEMGKGFCFVGRQKRITIEGDHFYVDLVFYNRLLRCFVLLDLKLDKLTHQDLGQMMMYVNYFDRTQRAPHEAWAWVGSISEVGDWILVEDEGAAGAGVARWRMTSSRKTDTRGEGEWRRGASPFPELGRGMGVAHRARRIPRGFTPRGSTQHAGRRH